MSIINWSDPEEMFGLLCEYVADELAEAGSDRARARFLARLYAKLERIAGQLGQISERRLIERLSILYDSQPAEFARDPVLQHLSDCIDELERIVG